MHERSRQNLVYNSFLNWIRITELIKIWFSLGSSSAIYSQEGREAYYQKIFEKYDSEISITAWFSHAMPLKYVLLLLGMPFKTGTV